MWVSTHYVLAQTFAIQGQKGLSWLFGLVTRFLCKKDVHRCAAFHYSRLRGGNTGIMHRKLGGIKQKW